MEIELPTARLSPKNQVTLLRGARGVSGAEQDGCVFGSMHPMRRKETQKTYPVIVLMTEKELAAREAAIREQVADPIAVEVEIAKLNGNVHRMALDDQRRIVLPKHFVAWLRLDREVYMFTTNRSVLLWKPEDWREWSSLDMAADEPGTERSGPSAPPCVMI